MNFESLFYLNPNLWPPATLSFLRILSVFIWVPLFGDSLTPPRVKVLLALLLTFCFWPLIEPAIHVRSGITHWTPLSMAIATLQEVFFGFAVGFASKAIIYATQVAANLVGTNMGFQVASLFNPAMGSNESAFTTFQTWLVILLLLSTNAHHFILRGLVSSFQNVPIAPSPNFGPLLQNLMLMTKESFIMAIRIAAPLLTVQLIVMIALGLLNRAIPQLNVFLISFPISFIVSMIVLFLSTGTLVSYLSRDAMRQDLEGYYKTQRYFTSRIKEK